MCESRRWPRSKLIANNGHLVLVHRQFGSFIDEPHRREKLRVSFDRMMVFDERDRRQFLAEFLERDQRFEQRIVDFARILERKGKPLEIKFIP